MKDTKNVREAGLLHSTKDAALRAKKLKDYRRAVYRSNIRREVEGRPPRA